MKAITKPYDLLPGVVSTAALAEHWKLYEGYVAGVNAGAQPLEYQLGGVVMHELFFRGLSPKPTQAVLPVFQSLLAVDWGTVDAFWRELRAAAMDARGWAVLGYRASDKMRVLSMDEHDAGVLGYEPLIVIDCYEHAYFMDYGTRKAEYLDSLWKVFDWQELEKRWSQMRALRSL